MNRVTEQRAKDSEAARRKRKLANELADLRERALASLEAQDYEVRGKTTGQIRRALLKRPRTKAKGR